MKSSVVKIGVPRNKADKMFSSFPIVLYKVTGDFGMSEEGEIREGRLINKDHNHALIYHPHDKDGCGSFEVVEQDGQHWVSSKSNWVNYGKFG